MSQMIAMWPGESFLNELYIGNLGLGRLYDSFGYFLIDTELTLRIATK